MSSYSKRKYIIIAIFLFVGIAYVIRLFSLQVLDATYKLTATKNVLRELVEYPSRGLIYDRHGELIVYNQAAYDLMATPGEIGAFDTLALCQILDVPIDDFRKSIQKARRYSRYKPSVVVKQISPERYALLQEKMYKFPGFYFQTRTLRQYTSSSAAHVLGYVGEVNRSVIDRDPYYRSGDYYGVSGVENSYEEYLRGKKGSSLFLVDVHNRVKGSYDKGRQNEKPVKGRDLRLSLDLDLQEYSEQLMQNKAGSVVAIEPSTGEILALVSTPGYNPEDLVGRRRMENFPRLVSDTRLPLYNRAIRAQYPPGSTFKMVNALIGLQENIITPQTRFMCLYGFHVGNFSQGCHHDQEFALTGSIEQSCNAYYSNVFKRTLEASKFKNAREGYETWRKHVVGFGFSQKLSREFGEELSGFIPDADFYQKRVFPYSRWRALPLISLAIGQGEIQTTPLQMANYAAILANRGFYYTPHVLKAIEGEGINADFKEKHYSTIDSIHFEEIIPGMVGVMSIKGTASNSRIPGLPYCGKTGTAENPHGPDHSTFIAFAPVDTPRIALSVYVENGKWGNFYAAPIASLLIEKYINDSIQPSRKNLEEAMLKANLLYPNEPNFISYKNYGKKE